MAIRKLRISNFKSFKNLEVELSKFNVLIGANASGKSNFIHIFEFLRDIITHSLDDAISMQGDVKYFRNINIGSSEDFCLEVISDQESVFPIPIGRGALIRVKTYEVIYKFALGFYKQTARFKITEDKLTLKCDFIRLERRGRKIEEKERLGQGEIILANVNGRVKPYLNLPETAPIEEADIIPPFLRKERLPYGTLLLESLFFFIPFRLGMIFEDISIYDFNPREPKKAVPITGKTELEENGSNLAIVLKNIIEGKETKRKFLNLIRDTLFFIDGVGVEKLADRSLSFKLREIYSKEQFLPAFLLSDGTINLTALIIALYFEEKPLIIVEEPERNIHPHLISKVVGMAREASQTKQIILTTHNSEVVKHTELENLLLIYRDKEGFSNISRPYEKEAVRAFLENEIGVEELYVQNLLGI